MITECENDVSDWRKAGQKHAEEVNRRVMAAIIIGKAKP